MSTSIVNAKIDYYLKERVDEVLARHGKTSSDAIRSLWQYLSVSRDLPDFMKDEKEGKAWRERDEAKSVLMNLAGCVTSSKHEVNQDYRELLKDSMEQRYGL